jgi:hypothetical protein
VLAPIAPVTASTVAVSIMSSNGVPIHRHVIMPEICGGATVMDGAFDYEEGDTDEGNYEAETNYGLC